MNNRRISARRRSDGRASTTDGNGNFERSNNPQHAYSAQNDMNTNVNNFDLEELLHRSTFEGLSAAEQEYVLRELGSVEHFECARTTLTHLPAALQAEEEALELDPNLFVRINERLEERARPWYQRVFDYMRSTSPQSLAYGGAGLAMLVIVGLTMGFGMNGSAGFGPNGMPLGANPADTLIETFADSGNVQSNSVDVDDSLLSLRGNSARQDLAYVARGEQSSSQRPVQAQVQSGDRDPGGDMSGAVAGLAGVFQQCASRRGRFLSGVSASFGDRLVSGIEGGADGTRAGPNPLPDRELVVLIKLA